MIHQIQKAVMHKIFSKGGMRVIWELKVILQVDRVMFRCISGESIKMVKDSAGIEKWKMT